MKKYSVFFGLAVLALAMPAQGITWDIVYDGDVLPTADSPAWTSTIDVGTATLGTDGATTYLNINTDGLNQGNCLHYYSAPAAEYAAANFDDGMFITARLRCISTTHSGGFVFGDGT